MKKILVITPIYKIIGREELNRDTECIHDLVKNWTQFAEIKVIFTYIRGLTRLLSFFNPEQFRYYINGYKYQCDNIPVLLLERQNIIRNQLEGTIFDKIRIGNKVKNEIDEGNYDIEIVHIPSSSKYFMPKPSKKNIRIAVLHYSDVLYLNKKKKKFIDYLENNFDKIFCRSNAIYQIFKNNGLKNLSDEIIYSGVPKIEYNIKLAENKFDSKSLNILYVGKLIKRKNLDMLINALSNISEKKWQLYIIGEGPMKNEYLNLVNQHKLQDKIFFLGKKKKEEVFEYMRKANIFCMPSIKETLGLVYLEAMANGCITIGTKNEGIDGIIKNGENGFLVNPDVEELTKQLEYIINLELQQKKKIIREAIKTGNYYNEADMSQRYYDIIAKVKK